MTNSQPNAGKNTDSHRLENHYNSVNTNSQNLDHIKIDTKNVEQDDQDHTIRLVSQSNHNSYDIAQQDTASMHFKEPMSATGSGQTSKRKTIYTKNSQQNANME